MDEKNSLNLPRTDFPMKADLVAREPQRLEKWLSGKLYERIQERRKGAEKFVLHDGPPFANGEVHIGTALNKILKDIIVRFQTIRGKCAAGIAMGCRSNSKFRRRCARRGTLRAMR